MQKVYLLLRQNQQTGPYNLSELLQFELSPYDLVWIEGQSAGWYYPQEIPEVRPHLSFLKPVSEATAATPAAEATQRTVKSVFVSLPTAALQPEKITPSTTQTQPPVPVDSKPVDTPFLAAEKAAIESPADVRKEKASTVTTEKTKTQNRMAIGKGVAAFSLAAAAFAALWMLRPGQVAGEAFQNPQTATALPTQSQELPAVEPTPETTTPVLKKSKSAIVKSSVKLPATANSNKIAEQNAKPKTADPAPEIKDPVTSNEAIVTAPEETKREAATAEAPKEKKKLRERLAELFGKTPEEKVEEAKPAEEDAGRRQSTRREAGSSLAQLVTVRFDIPNDWMMGIKGAKASLTNRSSETIAKATVQVVYYNDDGDLLDKKTITFTNIKSKQAKTVSVPDHQTATRLEYSVISAAGNEPMAQLSW